MKTDELTRHSPHRYLLRSYSRKDKSAKTEDDTPERRRMRDDSGPSSFEFGEFLEHSGRGVPALDEENLLIWQVARATAGSPVLFPPMTVNGVTLSDGALIRLNNPSLSIIEEAKALGSQGDDISLISIGAGQQRASDEEQASNSIESSGSSSSFLRNFIRLPGIVRQLADAVTDPTPVHHDVQRMWKRRELKAYWRFSSYMDFLPALDQLKAPGGERDVFAYLEAKTATYLMTEKVQSWVTECAEELIARRRSRL
jgi:hypothetical protein